MKRLSGGSAVSAWWWVVGACVCFRLLVPLAALGAEGRALPGLPAYDYGPFYGDANGFYATARELIAAAGRAAAPLVVVVGIALACYAILVRRLHAPSWVVAIVAGVLLSAATTAIVFEMQPSGSAAIGWPLLWAIPLAPLRVVPGLSPRLAFAVGLVLSLTAVGLTVVATALAGFWTSARRSVGLVAAVLFAVWPFVPGLVVGAKGWENGSWYVDAGLHLYAEPLSTALVVGAVALLVRERTSDLMNVLAGLALGFGTVVKLTNAVIAVVLIVIVACSRGRRAAILVAGAGAVFAPVLIAYWAQGYASSYDGAFSSSNRVWSLDYLRTSWSDSLLFTPVLALLLVLPAVVGAFLLPRRAAMAALVAPVVVTVGVYSAYLFTPLHPRFFYVVLPLVLILDAAGAVGVLSAWSDRRKRGRSPTVRVV